MRVATHLLALRRSRIAIDKGATRRPPECGPTAMDGSDDDPRGGKGV